MPSSRTTTHRQQRVADQPDDRGEPAPPPAAGRPRCRRRPRRRRQRQARPDARQRGDRPAAARHATEVTPYTGQPPTACGGGAGRAIVRRPSQPDGRRAGPALAVRHAARDRRAGATSAFRPISAPGPSVLREPTRGAGADRDRGRRAARRRRSSSRPGRPRARPSSRCPASSIPVTGGTRVQVDAAADLGAQRPGVVGDPRRAGQVRGSDGIGQPLGAPQPQVDAAAARVVARAYAAQQEPGAERGDAPSGRAG